MSLVVYVSSCSWLPVVDVEIGHTEFNEEYCTVCIWWRRGKAALNRLFSTISSLLLAD